ncbi:MAG: histidine phosphatase family protein, partial [Ilumatobacter sp.]|nr:histidine phosphatase family protein [Ilumatobacter sp.]
MNGMTRVVLIRHGESASNAGGWLSGQDTCGGLTTLG